MRVGRTSRGLPEVEPLLCLSVALLFVLLLGSKTERIRKFGS